MLEMLELSGARSETSAHLCGVDKKRGGVRGLFVFSIWRDVPLTEQQWQIRKKTMCVRLCVCAWGIVIYTDKCMCVSEYPRRVRWVLVWSGWGQSPRAAEACERHDGRRRGRGSLRCSHLVFSLPTSPFSLPSFASFSLSWHSWRRKPSLGPISLLCLTVATASRASILWRSMR